MNDCRNCSRASRGHSTTGCVVWGGHIKYDVEKANGYLCHAMQRFTRIRELDDGEGMLHCCCWVEEEV